MDCWCVEDEGWRQYHVASMRNVVVVVAHARHVVKAPLLRFVAPAPCGASLACSWTGVQVLIGPSGMCGGRLSTRCMEAFMAAFCIYNSYFHFLRLIVLTFETDCINSCSAVGLCCFMLLGVAACWAP